METRVENIPQTYNLVADMGTGGNLARIRARSTTNLRFIFADLGDFNTAITGSLNKIPEDGVYADGSLTSVTTVSGAVLTIPSAEWSIPANAVGLLDELAPELEEGEEYIVSFTFSGTKSMYLEGDIEILEVGTPTQA